MKKIRLDLDTLSIESFDTTAGASGARGTVHANRPPETEGWECDSLEVCTNYCGTQLSDCCTYDTSCSPYCGSGAYTFCCPTYPEATCADTCDPECCCTCSCY